MKKFFIILLVIVLVVIIAAVVLITLNKGKLMSIAMDATMNAMQKEVTAQFAEGAEADSVRAILNDAAVAVKANQADKMAFQSFMMSFKSGMDDKKLDSLEVRQLLDLAKQIPVKQE